MITFKTFLEAAVDGKQPKYKDLTVEKAIATLNDKCKDSLWMLHDNTPLWRGDVNIPSTVAPFFMSVDTSATVRRSENTSNYYTVILDNIPSMKGFPKRSRSFIGSTSQDRASIYGYMNNKFFVMIPYDDVKIGIVNQDDMWDSLVRLFGEEEHVQDFNRCWQSLFSRANIKIAKSVTWEDFKKLSSQMEKNREKMINLISQSFEVAEFRVEKELGKMTLLEYLNRQYSPIFTGFKSVTTKDKSIIQKAVKQQSEVWVGGKIMMISTTMWNRMRAAL